MPDSNLEAVLQAMIDEVNALHKARRPASENQLRAVETCRKWLNLERKTDVKSTSLSD